MDGRQRIEFGFVFVEASHGIRGKKRGEGRKCDWRGANSTGKKDERRRRKAEERITVSLDSCCNYSYQEIGSP